MNKTQMMAEKKLDQLQDLVTSLENAWFYEEAEELQEYLLNPKANAFYIVDKFKDKFEMLQKYIDTDGTDCQRDEEWNQYENDLKWLEKIADVEIDYVGYKDIVKYDDVYLFYDNVLSRWMVRWHQWLWLSNIERDTGSHGLRPEEYVERRKWVTEKIRRMPRVQEFTLKEYQRLLDKWWIDIDRTEVLSYTSNHYKEFPSLQQIQDMIEEENDLFEYENEWMKMTFKKDIITVNEDLEKIQKQEDELKMLLMKQEKEREELKKLARVC